MNLQQIIIFSMEIVGTVAFAASGAMVGIEKSMDIFGVCVLGVVTAVGGGMTRDIVLGIHPPGVFEKPAYVLVAVVTSCLVFVGMYFRQMRMDGDFGKIYDRAMLAMDSVGLGIFTAVGVNTGIMNDHPHELFLLVFVGTVTGVGGGLLRDMMAGNQPYIFVRHVYACASILGAFLCAVLYPWLGAAWAMFLSAAAVVVMRYLAAHYHWNLPRIGLGEKA